MSRNFNQTACSYFKNAWCRVQIGTEDMSERTPERNLAKCEGQMSPNEVNDASTGEKYTIDTDCNTNTKVMGL
jgi:hypothetical protein